MIAGKPGPASQVLAGADRRNPDEKTQGPASQAPFYPSPSLQEFIPMTVQEGLQTMKLQDLKNKKPADLLAFAEELEIENASSIRPSK